MIACVPVSASGPRIGDGIRGNGVRYNQASFPTVRFVGTPQEYVHKATDIFASIGSPVYAVCDGTVVKRADTPNSDGGYHMTIQGDDGDRFYYAHCNERMEPGVGGRVRVGQRIGSVGRTGNTAERGAGPHLHFKWTRGGVPTNAWYGISRVQTPPPSRPLSHNGDINPPAIGVIHELAMAPLPARATAGADPPSDAAREVLASQAASRSEDEPGGSGGEEHEDLTGLALLGGALVTLGKVT